MFCLMLATFLLAAPMADKIEIVKNGAAPAGKTYTLKLTETLRVGPDDDDNFIWSGSYVAVEADARGHMYVVDGVENRIVEIDENGKFVRQIGSTGEGPGEFQALISLHILSDGRAAAFDNFQTSTSFSFYDKNLKFVDKKKLAASGLIIQAVKFSPDGERIAANTVIRDGKAQKLLYQYSILDKDYQEKMLVHERKEEPFDNQRAVDGAYWAEYLGARFKILGQGDLALMTFDRARFFIHGDRQQIRNHEMGPRPEKGFDVYSRIQTDPSRRR